MQQWKMDFFKLICKSLGELQFNVVRKIERKVQEKVWKMKRKNIINLLTPKNKTIPRSESY